MVKVAKPSIIYDCPGCGTPIEPDQDYVVALEYQLPDDFDLHMKHDLAPAATRRFHVEHFRGRIADHFYELVEVEAPR